MATINPYFHSGIPMGRGSEQNLYEDLIIECLKIYGFELYYLPRKAFNEDRILGEDPLNNYQHAYPIEMYLESNTGFEGQGEFLSKFGVETVENANFVVSRKRWLQTAGDSAMAAITSPRMSLGCGLMKRMREMPSMASTARSISANVQRSSGGRSRPYELTFWPSSMTSVTPSAASACASARTSRGWRERSRPRTLGTMQ